MKFNEKWLREWVDPAIDRDSLLRQLTMAGLEVDGVEPVAEAFEGVVVARVVAVDKHPNADKLSVCDVDDGAARYQVVCGAPNVRPGLVTAFARVGAVLPGNFKIRKAKLRNVESDGMLCSSAELGVGDDADGIIELPEDAAVGMDLRSALDLDDIIVDLDLTPNRGDCLSVRGLAREVGVLNNEPVASLEVPVIEPVDDVVFPVELAHPEGCPRYLGRVISDVDINSPSPLWLKERLRRAGLRSIDAVVDVTNFVMLELGQPMHAFDLKQLRDRIVVRMAREGERLTLLDGQTVELDSETLLITDHGGPVAIAGVMGGDRSGVQADTRDVFLECAFFQPLAVAGTARRYGLHTDASHRYERGVDFELQHQAMERATGLLLEIVGGRPGPVQESVVADALPKAAEVSLREKRLNELLGVTVDPREVDAAFARLGFDLIERSEPLSEGVRWRVRAPSHRFDIAREADLVEEVCRIYGYNNIPSRRPPTALALRKVPILRSPVAVLKQQLAGLGYQEAITYSFVDPRLQDLLAPGVDALALTNPMSVEHSAMRVNLLPGLLDALRANVSRQQDRVRLFELGMVFEPGERLRQFDVFGMVCWGRREAEVWNQSTANVDFFDLKGDVERLLDHAGLSAEFVPREDPILHPGQSASVVVAGEIAGRLGRLHPEIEAQLDLTGPVYVAELTAETILRRGKPTFQGISRYPSVRRDLSLLVSRDTPAVQIEDVVRRALGGVLIDFTLFDLYEGKGIDSTEKSVGVGLTLQQPSATLTEEEIGQIMHSVVEALAAGVGARLR